MLTPSEALAQVLEKIPGPSGLEHVPLARAHGRCLAREAVSDVDIPPFEKSMMDGFAVRCADFAPERARAGVKVRFLYDAVGSWRLHTRVLNILEEAGGFALLLVTYIPVISLWLPGLMK